jgi:hypothetical protein
MTVSSLHAGNLIVQGHHLSFQILHLFLGCSQLPPKVVDVTPVTVQTFPHITQLGINPQTLILDDFSKSLDLFLEGVLLSPEIGPHIADLQLQSLALVPNQSPNSVSKEEAPCTRTCSCSTRVHRCSVRAVAYLMDLIEEGH